MPGTTYWRFAKKALPTRWAPWPLLRKMPYFSHLFTPLKMFYWVLKFGSCAECLSVKGNAGPCSMEFTPLEKTAGILSPPTPLGLLGIHSPWNAVPLCHCAARQHEWWNLGRGSPRGRSKRHCFAKRCGGNSASSQLSRVFGSFGSLGSFGSFALSVLKWTTSKEVAEVGLQRYAKVTFKWEPPLLARRC